MGMMLLMPTPPPSRSSPTPPMPSLSASLLPTPTTRSPSLLTSTTARSSSVTSAPASRVSLRTSRLRSLHPSPPSRPTSSADHGEDTTHSHSGTRSTDRLRSTTMPSMLPEPNSETCRLIPTLSGTLMLMSMMPTTKPSSVRRNSILSLPLRRLLLLGALPSLVPTRDLTPTSMRLMPELPPGEPRRRTTSTSVITLLRPTLRTSTTSMFSPEPSLHLMMREMLLLLSAPPDTHSSLNNVPTALLPSTLPWMPRLPDTTPSRLRITPNAMPLLQPTKLNGMNSPPI